MAMTQTVDGVRKPVLNPRSVYLAASRDSRPCMFDRSDLLACTDGELFYADSPRLPKPPLMMVDRIVEIDRVLGGSDCGVVRGEYDIDPNHWFFSCHFSDDPIMPGFLGVEALHQLLGFYLAWCGYRGRGRAIASGNTKFLSPITPDIERITYSVRVKRVYSKRITLAIADGDVCIGSRVVYKTRDYRVGLF